MIGRLKHRLSLLKAVRVSDGGGGSSVSYVPDATIWASTDLHADVSLEGAGTKQRRTRITFTIRSRPQMGLIERVIFEGRLFEILSISESPVDSLYLQIRTQEIAV